MLSSRTRHIKLPIMLAVLLLSTLACVGFEKTHCYWWEGGEWVNSNTPYTDGCCKTITNDCSEYQLSPWDTPSPTDAPAAEPGICYSESSAYEWTYQDTRQNSGTGGLACDARLVFRNNSSELLNLIVFTDWDNNAMHESGWKVFMVESGDSWDYKVSLTQYTDGSVTFSKVTKFQVIRDLPECRLFLTEGNETFWDLQAVSVDELVCQ